MQQESSCHPPFAKTGRHMFRNGVDRRAQAPMWPMRERVIDQNARVETRAKRQDGGTVWSGSALLREVHVLVAAQFDTVGKARDENRDAVLEVVHRDVIVEVAERGMGKRRV